MEPDSTAAGPELVPAQVADVQRVAEVPPKPVSDDEAAIGAPTPVAARKPGGAWRYLKRHWKAPLLFALFIGLLAAAYLAYPRRAPVYRPAPFAVDLTVGQKVTSIKIDVTQKSSDKFTLSLYITTVAPPAGVQFVDARINLTLPGNVRPAACPYPDCFSGVGDAVGYLAGDTTYSYTDSAFSPLTTSLGEWDSYVVFDLTAKTFAWDSNGLQVEAQLPAMTLRSESPKFSAGNPSAEVAYASGGSGSWSTGWTAWLTPRAPGRRGRSPMSRSRC